MYSSYSTLQRKQLTKQVYTDTQSTYLLVYAPGRHQALEHALENQLHRKFRLVTELAPALTDSVEGVLLVSEDLVFRSKETNMTGSVSVVVYSLAGLNRLNQENVAAAMAVVEETGLSRVLVTDSAGLVLYDTRETGSAVGKYTFYSEIVQALEGYDAFSCSYRDGAFRSRTASPVLYQNRIIGAVYAYEYDTEQAALLEGLQSNLLKLSAGIAAAVVLLSILLSRMLTRKGIKHNVLNAKQHAREAEIVAQAGKLGAVTIATNMAGRGTDIMLGGNAEFLAKAEMRKQGYEDDIINEAVGYADTENEQILAARAVYKELYDKFSAEVKEKAVEVKKAGGLYILGTERHESRRIDNQLRGRSGRQGDEGESCFFLSVEDDLMRIFAGERLENMMRTLNVEENMPIESRMLTKIIESSQKKVEGRNFAIRKNVLNYDDVMNKQREIIYEQRATVLNGDDIHEYILKMMEELIDSTVDQYLIDDDNKEDWNLVGLRDHFMGWITVDGDLEYEGEEYESITKDEIKKFLTERTLKAYADREAHYGAETLRELERVILLKVVDTKWMAHIDDMDELKRGIGLRAMGNKNPVVEYRFEGMDMFDAMIDSIREDTVRLLLTVQLQQNQVPEREQVAKPDAPNAGAGDGSFSNAPAKKKIGPNEPCPCGSGKKYKLCCGMKK